MKQQFSDIVKSYHGTVVSDSRETNEVPPGMIQCVTEFPGHSIGKGVG